MSFEEEYYQKWEIVEEIPGIVLHRYTWCKRETPAEQQQQQQQQQAPELQSVVLKKEKVKRGRDFRRACDFVSGEEKE